MADMGTKTNFKVTNFGADKHQIRQTSLIGLIALFSNKAVLAQIVAFHAAKGPQKTPNKWLSKLINDMGIKSTDTYPTKKRDI